MFVINSKTADAYKSRQEALALPLPSPGHSTGPDLVPTAGLSAEEIEETKVALRELGLPYQIQTE